MKTLQELYTADEFAKLVPEIDEATAANLYSYFGDRIPVTGFPHYVHMKMLLYADQYIRMQRDESVKYDAMVTDYLEAKYTDKTDKSGKTTTTTSGSDTNDSKTETDTNGSSQTDAQHVDKTNPMQVVYNNVEAGQFPPLKWDTADTQTEDKTENTTTGKETAATTGSASHNSTVTGDNSGSDKTVHTERRTGRSGRNPAELLEASLHYIVITKSFGWLVDRLNNCFIWSIDL